jgi:predicted amidohydrolase
MRVGIFQGPSGSGEVDGNLDLLESVARDAARRGAALLVCPEMFLTGYAIGGDATRRLAEPADGPAAQRAAAIARRCGLALLFGYPERAPDGRVFNAALLLDRTGRRLANHRKAHLFGAADRGAFAAGETLTTIADLDGLKTGILICYDVEFPESARLLALAGVDLVAVPTALMAPYAFIPHGLVAARAYENQVFLAYANRCGREADLVYEGASCIVGPDGRDLARAGRGQELILADLDPAAQGASRRINTYLRDRRPDLYGPLAGPAGDPEKAP